MKKLLKFFLSLTLLLIWSASLLAQSAVSNVISFDSDEVNELFMPPDLKVDIEFVDENGTGVLEALERAYIRIKIMNEGGSADDVNVSLLPERTYKGLNYPAEGIRTKVLKNASKEVEIPLSASIDVATCKDVRFGIKISEPYGYDINATLEFPMLGYQKAELQMSGVSIIDAGRGLKAYNGNPDGKIQRGDVVMTSVHLQNIGLGMAENITYTITTNDKNVYLLTDSGPSESISGKLTDMSSSQVEEISFRMSANHNYVNEGGYLPIYLTVKEDKGFGDIVSQNIPIPFDASPMAPNVVTVDADLDKILADLGRSRVTSEDGRVNSNMSSATIRDISVAPVGEKIYPDAVAIVIGSEKYSDNNIPRAPYAARDAEVISEYFRTSLGVGTVNTMTDEEVTSMEMTTLFDSQRGKLSRMITPGETDVFVYYSGHGVPMETENGGKDIFLIPYDVQKDWIKDYGFSLNKMYRDLEALHAKSVTVILDACFSGGSRPSEQYKSESIANQKLVIMDAGEMEQPWIDDPDFRLFTSSRGDQTSQGYDLSRSGLFTYYLALGLQGEADDNGDKKITMSELVDYVTANVDKDSMGTQTPQFYGNDDFIIEKL